MRILIAGGGTGGHLMPALSIAAALQETMPDTELVLVGSRRGVEADILPRRPFRHCLLPAEPLYRRRWWRNVRWVGTVGPLAFNVRRLLRRERPVLVVGTGGYAAAPVLLGARLAGLPLVLQEQNAYPGLTTRWFAAAARQLHLGFPEAASLLRVGAATEVFTLGNPIVPPGSAPDRGMARRQLGIGQEEKVLFVVGGSQGARGLNSVVARVVESGRLDDLTLCWSTGPAGWANYRRYDAPPRRIVRSFWDPIGEAYAAADLVIARAGAMATAELCAFGLPSILVPLPSAAADHQTKNAEALAAAGAAVHLPERDLTPVVLLDAVQTILGDAARAEAMHLRALARARPDAARRIAEAIATLVREQADLSQVS
jgi:UDP-N-acetylglucosamine--N-acetylmuramyl-(pentapeptide) pyrophosphoryl-undecaprenol N-acetylglucosamine transferase